MAEDEVPGPVDFTLIEFPSGAPTGPTAEALSGLLDAGILRLYDIALLHRSDDGRARRLDLTDGADAAVGGFSAFAGARSGLFDQGDLDDAAQALEPGRTGVLIAYENAWAVPFVAAALDAGGQLVASQRIPVEALLEALDAAEAAG